MVFGGDVLGYYYHADEIIDVLKENNVICLLGNHDKMFLELLYGKRNEEQLIQKYGNSYRNIVNQIKKGNVEFLKGLELSYVLDVDFCKMGFFHGGPQDPLNMRIYPDTEIEQCSEFDNYDFVFVGHTHHKMIKKVGNCEIVNPGSLGQQRDGKGCSYIIFDTQPKSVQFYTIVFDREKLVTEINRMETQENMRERLIEVLYREQ